MLLFRRRHLGWRHHHQRGDWRSLRSECECSDRRGARLLTIVGSRRRAAASRHARRPFSTRSPPIPLAPHRYATRPSRPLQQWYISMPFRVRLPSVVVDYRVPACAVRVRNLTAWPRCCVRFLYDRCRFPAQNPRQCR